jgi:hypothetical protein
MSEMKKDSSWEEAYKKTFSYEWEILGNAIRKLKEEIIKEFGKLLVSIWRIITSRKRI